jgi:HSP20 family protein
MLLRFDPFDELDRWMRPTAARTAGIPMDAYRQGDRLAVHLDLPGVDPDSIDVTIEKNVLTVSAERRWTPEEGQQVLANERPQGRFSRRILLSDGLDPERVEARYDHGVLTLHVPVAETAKPRKVAVTTGDEHRAIEATAEAA